MLVLRMKSEYEAHGTNDSAKRGIAKVQPVESMGALALSPGLATELWPWRRIDRKGGDNIYFSDSFRNCRPIRARNPGSVA